jgi:hypothetical protein
MGMHLKGLHLIDVHLEAAVTKPAVPELCPQQISRPIVSRDTSRQDCPCSALKNRGLVDPIPPEGYH